MIIWINGAFGSGKSQTAFELNRRISDSFLYDPENAGYFIRKNVSAESKVSDFQHYPMWREFNYSMLRYLDETSLRTIIVPMTITDVEYFDEIVGRLRGEGVIIHHYTLCASREVLLKRLRSRGDGFNSWPAQQIDRCIQGLSHEVFGHHLDTDSMSIDAVVEHIASMSAIDLLTDHRTHARKRFDRIVTQIKQFRLFH